MGRRCVVGRLRVGDMCARTCTTIEALVLGHVQADGSGRRCEHTTITNGQ